MTVRYTLVSSRVRLGSVIEGGMIRQGGEERTDRERGEEMTIETGGETVPERSAVIHGIGSMTIE